MRLENQFYSRLLEYIPNLLFRINLYPIKQCVVNVMLMEVTPLNSNFIPNFGTI
ncbi:hypothetical protein BCV72DRAFT_234900, partial [Rhizopus microsporus var. microsporus]